MGRFIDLTGQRFGMLEVKELAGMNKWGASTWSCICDCGNTKEVQGGHLRKGHTRSCGCLHKEQISEMFSTHGQCRDGLRSREYECWHSMKGRCYNPNTKSYKNYGGRGIKVCDRWLDSFENFFEDMGKCPPGMTLDRKDNDGDYDPSNCRWATWELQANNKRNNVWYKHKGIVKTIPQWARKLGLSEGALYARLNNPEWSIERALTTPVGFG